MQLNLEGPTCPEPLEKTEDSLHYQLGEFSRKFEIKNWKNAQII